jgi:hypothetical protein
MRQSRLQALNLCVAVPVRLAALNQAFRGLQVTSRLFPGSYMFLIDDVNFACRPIQRENITRR